MQLKDVSGRFFPLLLSIIILLLLMTVHSLAAPSPFGVGLPETTGPISMTGPWGQVQRWILAQQADFYMALKEAVKLVEESWVALGALLGLSFGYGVFHAAGPGHGKVVLTTYLFASGATARRGALLAMIAAMLQASVAVILIGIAAVALNLTAMVITQTALVLELASYALFVILGLWLLARAFNAFASLRGQRKAAHDHHHEHHHDHHHDHDHDHDGGECGCGHTHAPSLEVVDQAIGFRGMVLAVLSMGLRPCSGALIVLVFALSQKVFWAGVLSAYAMGIGTGLSIAILALVAVYARSFSQKLAEKGLSNALFDWFGASILLLAGLVVLGFGSILLLANLL